MRRRGEGLAEFISIREMQVRIDCCARFMSRTAPCYVMLTPDMYCKRMLLPTNACDTLQYTESGTQPTEYAIEAGLDTLSHT